MILAKKNSNIAKIFHVTKQGKLITQDGNIEISTRFTFLLFEQIDCPHTHGFQNSKKLK